MADTDDIRSGIASCISLIGSLAAPARPEEAAQWREVLWCLSLARDAARAGDLWGADQELRSASAEADDCRRLPLVIRRRIDTLWLDVRRLRVGQAQVGLKR